MPTPAATDTLRKLLDDYDASGDGPLGDLLADMCAQARRLGYRGNTCGSVVVWSRRYLARHANASRTA